MKRLQLLAAVLILTAILCLNGEAAMSDWKIVVPEYTRNLIAHPSVELTDVTGWTAHNMATFARSAVQSKWGLYSLAITPGGGPDVTGVYYQVIGTALTDYTFSVWVYGVLGDAYTLRLIDGVAATLGTTAFTGTGAWQLVEVSGTTAANTTVRCYLTKNTAGGAVFYADGWQLEAKAYRTTYVDGTRFGCEWMGTEHASISQRSAQSRAGGRIRDLQTDYGLEIGGVMGVGTPPQTVHVDEFALTPGGQYGSTKIHPRTFLVTGAVHGASCTDLHAKRQALITLFDVKAHPESQPVTLRYTGAPVEKEIQIYYEGGLEGAWRADRDACYMEKVAIRFTAPDPFWYEVGEHSAALDSNDTDLYLHIAGRRKDTGQWDTLGVTTAPVTNVPWISDIQVSPDGNNVYVAGWFESWNGVDGADNLVRYNVPAGTWHMVGPAHSFDAATTAIYGLAMGLNDILYIAGNFTNVGDGNGDYIVSYDLATNSFTSLGTGLDNIGRAVVVAHNGTVFVGGEFHNAGGGGAEMHIAQFSTTGVWSAVGAGLNDNVYVMALMPNGDIIAGGIFTDLQGGGLADANAIVGWNGTAYYALSTGLWWGGGVAECWSLAVDTKGLLYAGGLFDKAGSVVGVGGAGGPNVSTWNGNAWSPLGAGSPAGVVHTLQWGPDDMLYSVGYYFQAASDLARWTGSVWARMDTILPTISPFAMAVGRVDPVVGSNYDLFVGSSGRGNAQWSGIATATPEGTTSAWPIVKIGRIGGQKGGAGGTARILAARNERTGKVLLFDYELLNGETLAADLTPTKQSIKSSWPPTQGRACWAILPSGDTGQFALRPGANQITCFVYIQHAEFNDNNNQLSEWEGITGLVYGVNTDATGNLYATIVNLGAGNFRVDLFSDAARLNQVGHTAVYAASGFLAIVPDGGSGLGGTIRAATPVAGDADIYVACVFVDAHMVWTDRYSAFD